MTTTEKKVNKGIAWFLMYKLMGIVKEIDKIDVEKQKAIKDKLGMKKSDDLDKRKKI